MGETAMYILDDQCDNYCYLDFVSAEKNCISFSTDW